jgi:uncharacterized protein
MSEANINLVKSLYDAFGRRDQATILSLIDPAIDIQQTDQLPWGGSYHGPQGMLAFFEKLLNNVESKLAIEKFVDAGNDVVMVGRTQGQTKSKNTPFDVSAIHVWTIREGKIVGFHPYIDTPGMLKALAA